MSIKNELTKTASYLRSARKAIIGRGGEISLAAGLKDLSNAIYRIPADASLAFQTDDSVAYQKIVPSGAEEFAQVAKVGGMTYKEISTQKNLIRDVRMDGWTSINGSSITKEFISYEYMDIYASINAYDFSDKLCTFSVYGAPETLSVHLMYVVRDENSNHVTPETFVQSGESFEYSIPNNGEADCVIFINGYVEGDTTVTLQFMINEGEEALPYEPVYYVLRDTKVTELKSEGANLWSASWEIGGISAEKGESIPDTGRVRSDFVKISPKAIYTIKRSVAGGYVQARFYDKNKSFISTANESIWKVIRGSTTGNPMNASALSFVCQIINPDVAYMRITDTTNDLSTIYSMYYGNYDEVDIPEYTSYKGVIDTFTIPEEIQAIEGYGRGVNADYYNYIDFERKVFAQRTYRKVFDGTERWYVSSTVTGEYLYFQLSLPDKPADTFSGIMNQYEHASVGSTSTKQGWHLLTSGYIRVRPDVSVYTTEILWKSHLAELYASGNPLTIEYALATPIETDISAYLTDDNFIEVEGGGTIKAVNEFEFDAPSTINYIAKVGG